MLEWNRLVSDCRVWDDDKLHPSPQQPDRTAFQVDYDRIIFSEPFRRLARKTQVHPLVPNDHIRNRLTHSLEVAGVGRSFGTRLWRFLRDRSEELRQISEDDFRQILQSACLAHDIGNPPFGHAGEFALRMWVKENPEVIFGKDDEFAISDGLKSDWLNFEGNAQGFRLACRADNGRFGYMNLTASTLATMVKYPWGSLSPKVVDSPVSKRKFNFFSSEQAVFDTVFESLGLKIGSEYIRHPLSFLSEAADDLCYRIADLEDAVKMKIIQEERVRGILLKVCDESEKSSPLGRLRAVAIGKFIDGFWNVFRDDYGSIMRGDRKADLKAGIESKYASALSDVGQCYEEIFAHRFKVATELGAFNCLGRILKTMCDAIRELCSLELPASNVIESQKEEYLTAYKNELGFRSKRLFELSFGESYVRENFGKPYEWWLHQVMDFVSGMTDNFAQQLAREIEGF